MSHPLSFHGTPWTGIELEVQQFFFYQIPIKKFFPISKLLAAAAAAKSLQSYSTLCDPTDGSPSGSSVPGILQARTLEWVAISFSNAWKWKVKVKSLSRDFTPWTAAYQAPPSLGFSRQEYWSGVPLPSPYIYYKNVLTTNVPLNLLLIHEKNFNMSLGKMFFYREVISFPP